MAKSALIADTAGDGWIHDNQFSGLDTGYLLPDIGYDRAALVADGERELHDLIPDPPLCVIVEIGSADAHTADPEQYVCGVAQGRHSLFNNFNLSYSRKDHSFHRVDLQLRSFYPIRG
jgi:hypothetical protein